MPTIIVRERPDSVEAKALIRELDDYLGPLYPPTSQHGLSVAALIAEKVDFFVLRCGNVAVGCGGVKFYEEYAEIKRMYVRPSFRGKGLAKRMLAHLEAHAVRAGIFLLRLETGIRQPEAQGLYEALGYRIRPPFGEYSEDPLSLFFEKDLRTVLDVSEGNGHTRRFTS